MREKIAVGLGEKKFGVGMWLVVVCGIDSLNFMMTRCFV